MIELGDLKDMGYLKRADFVVLDEIEAKFQTSTALFIMCWAIMIWIVSQNLNFSHIRAITGVRKENLIIPSYGTRSSLSCSTVIATRMVPIMIPVIRLDESVCPGRAEGMALAGTEERRFARS